jgi:formylglycine-generating enzyme required for sulfatase activity
VKTSSAPPAPSDPRLQPGNAALRFGAARVLPKRETFDPADRQRRVEALRATGREVADVLGIRFVTIPPGRFMKGENGTASPSTEATRVVLTKPYEIATGEITQGEWARVMGTQPWRDREFVKDSPEHAASWVSWDDAQEFLARLNACGERRYRLPTEAEWEWASRSGPGVASSFWFAPEQIGEFAWHFDNTVRAGQAHAQPVGRRQANPRGLFDLVGNVHEWCHDLYGYQYWRRGGEKVDPMGAAPGASPGNYRVLRGGSFYYRPRQLLTYPGSRHRPGYRNFDVGFRVVRLLP